MPKVFIVTYVFLELLFLTTSAQSNKDLVSLPVDSVTGKIIYTATIKNDDTFKDSLFLKVKAWIDSLYDHEYLVFQVSDQPGGKIKIKGDVILKVTYSKLDLQYHGEHVLEINVRDNEYDYTFRDFKFKKFNEISNNWYTYHAEDKYPPEKKVAYAKKMYVELYNKLDKEINVLAMSLVAALGEYDKSAEEELFGDDDDYWSDDDYWEEEDYWEDKEDDWEDEEEYEEDDSWDDEEWDDDWEDEPEKKQELKNN